MGRALMGRSVMERGERVEVVRRLLVVVAAGVERKQLEEVARALRMEVEEGSIPEVVAEVVRQMQVVVGLQTLPCPRKRM